MRLYLSSYRLGNDVDKLEGMVGGERRVAVIENALDHISEKKRREYLCKVHNIYDVFSEIEYNPEPLDLRDYFEDPQSLETHLRSYDLIWAVGGNAFLLRKAMAQSGFDKILPKLLKEDAVAYGGWSAGVCVLSPSLHGIEMVDDKDAVVEKYDPKIIWDGLGVLDFSIAPHYRSDHPESVMIDGLVEFFKDNDMKYLALRDGDVCIVNHTKSPIVYLRDNDWKRPFDKDKAQPCHSLDVAQNTS